MSEGEHPGAGSAGEGGVMTVDAQGRLLLPETVCRQHRLRPGDRVMVAGAGALDDTLWGLLALSTGLLPEGGLVLWRLDDLPGLAAKIERRREDLETCGTDPLAP